MNKPALPLNPTAVRWQKLKRRVVTIPRAIVGLVVLLALAPLLFLLGGLYDLITGQFSFPTPRLLTFLILFLGHELVAIGLAVPLWLGAKFGRTAYEDKLYESSHRMQSWLVASLLRSARWTIGLELDFQATETIPDGDIILMSRHASMVDAMLPAFLFTGLLDRPVHYLLKQEMQSSPMFDIYGHRLANHFVTRGSNTEREVAAIENLARHARDDSALVIFPEGTFATPPRRAKVHASLESKGLVKDLAFARGLSVLLPPKPVGTLALMRNRPGATVVIMGHVGLEGTASLSGLWKNCPMKNNVVIRWWSHPAETLPNNDEGRLQWLQQQWTLLDNWVAAQLQERA